MRSRHLPKRNMRGSYSARRTNATMAISGWMKGQKRTGEPTPASKPASISSDTNHDVAFPPTGTPRPRRPPSTRRTDDAQIVLPHLQIVVLSDTKAPLRLRRIPHPEIPHRTVEEEVSGPLHLSRSLHAQSLHSWHSAHPRRGYVRRWLDPHLSQPRAFALGVPWLGG
jgi:hypothetical protein